MKSPATAADLILHKVPSLSVEKSAAYPINVARYRLGAQVEASPKSQSVAQLQLSANGEDSNVAEAALLCDDPTVGYALPSGTTTLLVSLAQIENVGSISLMNKGAAGDVTIAAANAKLPANSPQWQTLVQQELSGDGLHADVGPAEAKYVRLTFNIHEAGRIAALGVYASAKVSDFTMPRASQFAVQDKSDSFTLISNNVSDVHAKARALYVSSGSDAASANNMIDEQASTTYTFAAPDAAPTTVIDLGKSATLRRLSAVYSPRAGSMQFYLLNALPGASAPEELKLDDAAFATIKPVGVATDDGTRGRAAVDFPAVTGRYVLVRWLPAAQDADPFSIAEVAAFGKAAGDGKLLAANTGLTLAQIDAAHADGKTMMDGKTVIEPKDESTALPESPVAEGPPPTLPQPPPFTFIPVMVPNSP
ncbi:MAG: hypothetical protein M3032_10615 [Verrucomicrobiota bacterium]|nr:hypothetical protein [Verrucomicrobiota bacterium]